MLERMKCLTLLLVLAQVALPTWCDTCDRRDRRTWRAWKGDTGDLLQESLAGGNMVRDRLQLHHRRARRFLSFPTGSTLTITPSLSIPWISLNNGDVTGAKLYKFPIDIRLPNATVRLSKFTKSSNKYNHTGYGNRYNHWKEEDPYNRVHNEHESSYSEGYEKLRYNYEKLHYNYNYNMYNSYLNHKNRALDNQRLTGFRFLEKLLENFGLDGHACLLRAVCEIGEDPIDDLGVSGEIINLFFSVGYGTRDDELTDYIAAEESGRTLGGCENLYQSCPFHLMDMMQSAFSYFHEGLAHVGNTNANNLLS